MNRIAFGDRKATGEKLVVTTCYEYWSARLLAETGIDALLVGDSVAMVVHGYPSTLFATVEMMTGHIAAVARGAPKKFIIGDMPFPSFRKGVPKAMAAVDTFMKAGAHAVKVEGIEGHARVIRHIVQSGVPVMGHLGLTPQSVHQMGGYRVQGRNPAAASTLLADAKRLEDLGCFAIVLECIPAELAGQVTQSVEVPTIGIGAGRLVDGQVLVLHDLLGLHPDRPAKFVREFLDGREQFRSAVSSFVAAVRTGGFPAPLETYND